MIKKIIELIVVTVMTMVFVFVFLLQMRKRIDHIVEMAMSLLNWYRGSVTKSHYKLKL
jgi:hypothetical protein